MKSQRVILLVLAAVLLAASAGAVEEGWRLRADVFFMDPSDGLDYETGVGRFVDSDPDTGVGGGINAEYRFSNLMGLELGVLAGAEVGFAFSNTVSMTAVCAGVNFHFPTEGKADVYAGPLLAVVEYGDFTAGPWLRIPGRPLPPLVRVSLDTDFAIGANLGVDFPLGEGHWLFNANARYLVTDIAAQTDDGIHDVASYDPLMLGFGFGYRF